VNNKRGISLNGKCDAALAQWDGGTLVTFVFAVLFDIRNVGFGAPIVWRVSIAVFPFFIPATGSISVV